MPIKSPPYDVGDRITLHADFYNREDVLADPTSVSAEINCPDGQIIEILDVDIDRVSQGKYEYEYLVANGYGYYYVTWRGTGSIAIVREKKFPVRRPFVRD